MTGRRDNAGFPHERERDRWRPSQSRSTAARTLRISDHVSELWSAGPESDVYPLFAFEQGAAWIGRSDPNACQTCADIPDLTPTLYLSCEE